MAVLASLLKYWRVIVFLVGLAIAGLAYYLWKDNQGLRSALRDRNAEIVNLEAARQRDAEAAHRLIEAANAEKARLQAQLDNLSEIQDEEGRAYLGTRVPDSVRKLLNTK